MNCDLIKFKSKSNNLTTPHPHQPCYQPSHSQMNNLFDLRPKMQMGHGPIGAVKFQAAFIKQALGCTWARDVLRLTGFIWAGTGHNQARGAAHWAPGAERGARRTGRRRAPGAPRQRFG